MGGNMGVKHWAAIFLSAVFAVASHAQTFTSLASLRIKLAQSLSFSGSGRMEPSGSRRLLKVLPTAAQPSRRLLLESCRDFGISSARMETVLRD